MTIFEASSKLIEWFSEFDIFNEERDMLKLLTIIDNDDDEVVILSALKKLNEEGFVVAEKNKKGETIHILIKKLFFNQQQLTVNGTLALEISTRVNWFAENITKNENDFSNPLSLTEADLVKLVGMYDFFKKSFDETVENS